MLSSLHCYVRINKILIFKNLGEWTNYNSHQRQIRNNSKRVLDVLSCQNNILVMFWGAALKEIYFF